MRYDLFGARLEADRPIAGLQEVADAARADILIRVAEWPLEQVAQHDLAAAPFYRSPVLDPQARPFVEAWHLAQRRYIRLRMSDGASFTLARAGDEIWVAPGAIESPLAAQYLVGPVLAFALRCRGVVALHASAVALNGEAVAFVGAEGAGKSSLAACLALRNHEVITDDVAALLEREDGMYVQPGAPYLRMRPGVIERVAEQMGRRADLTPSPDGEHIDFVGSWPRGEARAPRRLAAVYLLDWTPPLADEVVIQPLEGVAAIMTLAADTWASRPGDAASRAAELDLLARLVQRVPMRRVKPGVRPALPELADRITADIRILAGRTPERPDLPRA